MRKWQRANPDKIRENIKRYRDKDPERYRAIRREAHRAWKRANLDKRRVQSHRRRARKLENDGTHTAADIQAQYKSQKGRCWYCGKKVGDKYEVDHRVPLSRGGSNAPENLVIACQFCNRSKGAKLVHEWSDRLL
jgi:5-methylcytosine-specific restriction endonuclease McrA